MTPSALVFGYFVGGLASSVLVVSRAPVRCAAVWGSALLALVVWPLWLPFAFASGPPVRSEPRPRLVERRISSAVERARGAVSGTALDGFLSEREANAILREVDRIGRRLDAVEQELDAGMLASARNRERLAELARSDSQALDDVNELAELLATELTLARHGRSESVEPLVAELSARVEALASS